MQWSEEMLLRERERERAWGKQSTGHAYGPLLVSFSTAFLLTTYGPSQPRLMAPLPIRMGKAAVTKHAQGHWPGNVAPTQQAYSLAPTGFIWPGECERPPSLPHPRLTSTSYHAAHNPSASWQCYYCPKMHVWDAQSKICVRAWQGGLKCQYPATRFVVLASSISAKWSERFKSSASQESAFEGFFKELHYNAL